MSEPNVTETDVDVELDAIDAIFDQWEQADKRSNDACHESLAAIFVDGPKFDDGGIRREALERRVRRNPDVAKSKSFSMSDKTAAELMLTMLFGLKKGKGAKSNWKAALRGAEKALAAGNLKRTKVDFKKWIGKTKLAGARKLGKGEPAKFDYSALDAYISENWKIELPEAIPEDAHFPEGVAVIVVKLDDSKSGPPKADYLGYVEKTHIIEGAARAVLQLRKHEQAEAMEDLIRASGDPELLIPKVHRESFGRAHFTDEDERDDFYNEQQYQQRETRKRMRKGSIGWIGQQMAKPTKGTSLPFDRHGEFAPDLACIASEAKKGSVKEATEEAMPPVADAEPGTQLVASPKALESA